MYLKHIYVRLCVFLCRRVSHHHEDEGDGHEDVGESHDALVS